MPVPPILQASGSPRRLLCSPGNAIRHIQCSGSLTNHGRSWQTVIQIRAPKGLNLVHTKTPSGVHIPHDITRLYSSHTSDSSIDQGARSISDSGASTAPWKEEGREPSHESLKNVTRKAQRFQVSNKWKRRERPSRSTAVLCALSETSQRLYRLTSPDVPEKQVDISYNNPRRVTPGSIRRNALASLPTTAAPLREPDSLYTILVRYLEWQKTRDSEGTKFDLTLGEIRLLRLKGFTLLSVEKWANCLSVSEPSIAARFLNTTNDIPPLFVLLLFLRRIHINVVAFGIILKHFQSRAKTELFALETLQIVSTRLLRHARIIWPAAMPWIAQFFCTHMRQIEEARNAPKIVHGPLASETTRFANIMLLLLSMPAASHPVQAAVHQEKAQFHILHFMANATPPIIVTRLGFRAVARTQLAHSKTSQEREWAQLKRPSWPPWKESRTAMDEDKGYEFGASRASKILQRMFGAGYGETGWERLAEIYAGWDTDLSPTIQTRTSLPQVPARSQGTTFLNLLQWAARVRTTRTKREAWACFLAYEASGAPRSEVVFLAMFERLCQSESKQPGEIQMYSYFVDVLGLAGTPVAAADELLPGDMKEVIAEPTSPLHQVYISEPVPTIEGFYHRLQSHDIRPSGRLLALLMVAYPNIQKFTELLESVKTQYDGGLYRLVQGRHLHDALADRVPNYLMAAFVRSMCNFGRFSKMPTENPGFESENRHSSLFGQDPQYLLHYAHALLLHYKPCHLPTWTAYMKKIVTSMDSTPVKVHLPLFRILCQLIETLKQIELDIDDETFTLVCVGTLKATHAAYNGIRVSTEDEKLILEQGSRRLRILFNSLTGAVESDDPDLPLPIPTRPLAPHNLHAYVRALGTLGDYEGLYSFSTWLTRHHEEVSIHAQARKGGMNVLRRTLVATRAALEGRLLANEAMAPAGEDLMHLVKERIDEIENWGGWPTQEAVEAYVNHRKTS